MWPYGTIASINSTSPVVEDLGSDGCGACLQISCVNKVSLLGHPNAYAQDCCAVSRHLHLNSG